MGKCRAKVHGKRYVHVVESFRVVRESLEHHAVHGDGLASAVAH